MSFLGDIKNHTAKVRRLTPEVFIAIGDKASDSIINGSALTGAPGQVVADVGGGNLRDSWTIDASPEVIVISTPVVYAPPNETGITEDGRPYVQRSAIGGRHSVSKTIEGIQLLADEAARELNG